MAVTEATLEMADLAHRNEYDDANWKAAIELLQVIRDRQYKLMGAHTWIEADVPPVVSEHTVLLNHLNRVRMNSGVDPGGLDYVIEDMVLKMAKLWPRGK